MQHSQVLHRTKQNRINLHRTDLLNNQKLNLPNHSAAANTKASQNSPASLRKALNECMMRDRFRLSKLGAGASRIKNEQSKNVVFDEIALDIAKSMMTANQRASHNQPSNTQRFSLLAKSAMTRCEGHF